MAGRGDISAGKAFVELFVKQNALTAGLRKASATLRAFGASARRVGVVTGAAGGAIAAPFAAAVGVFTRTGDALDKMSARTGASVGFLSELGFAMEQSGSDSKTLEAGLRGLSRSYFNLQKGSKEAVDAFSAVGISIDDLAGKSPEEQFAVVADGLAGIQDEAARAAIAQQLMGRSGAQLIPLMAGGAAGIQKLRQEARELGLTKTEGQTKSAAELTDAINRVRKAIGATIFEIGAALAPVILRTVNAVKTVVLAVQKWVRENSSLAKTIFTVGLAVSAAGAALVSIGVAASLMGVALGAVASGIALVGTMIAAVLSPIGLIAAAVAGGIAAWAAWTDSGRRAVSVVSSALAGIGQTVRDTFGGIFDAIAGGNLKLAGQIAFTGLKLAANQGITAVANLVGNTWGDAVAGIGSSLMSGDFTSAWKTGITALGAAWSKFASFIVHKITAAARAAAQIWNNLVSNIAKGLIREASKDTLTGKVASKILGIDVNAEAKKAARINAERVKLGLQPLGSALDAANQAVDAQADASMARVNAMLDGVDLKFESKAAAADAKLKAETGGAREQLVADTAATQAELDRLLAEAKKAAADKRQQQQQAAAQDEVAERGNALGGARTTGAGSFSGAAILALGGGGTIQQRMAGDIRDQRKAMRLVAGFLASLDRKVKGDGGQFQ